MPGAIIDIAWCNMNRQKLPSIVDSDVRFEAEKPSPWLIFDALRVLRKPSFVYYSGFCGGHTIIDFCWCPTGRDPQSEMGAC